MENEICIERPLAEVKEGEFIYTNKRFGSGLYRSKVEKITNEYLVIGSRGDGRYGSFDIVYYFAETDEYKKQYRIQTIKSAINRFGGVNLDKIEVTNENANNLVNAINTIRKAIKE
jgi:hypothetical protein